jgi:DNA mismatch repair protein MutL
MDRHSSGAPAVAPESLYFLFVTTIRVLPDALVNQIAAGEVVERPASVVKELVENALDAGARHVVVRLDGGGSRRVEVEDDGVGMSPDDALLALERHATSKIAAPEDLARISTMGFRGEALPSIAAASRLTIETAVEVGEGTRVEVDFGRIVSVRPHARPRGTRVVVEELFARLPARRKFLRSEATELRHALATITAVGFARPEVGVELEHNRKTLLLLPAAADAARRLADLLGAQRARLAHPIAHNTGAIAISGFLFPPAGARETIVVVNRRPLRDRLLVMTLNRALRGAGGTAEADAFVALQIPLDQVDVNVHPAKAEVRFVDPGRVVGALTAAIVAARTVMHGPAPIRRLVTVPASAARDDVAPPWSGGERGGRPLDFLWVAEATPSAGMVDAPPARSAGRYLGQYRSTYLIVEDDDGLLLVDQHAAHERVIFERLLATPGRTPSQPLLVPELVELSPAQSGLAAELHDELEKIGLDLEVVSGNTARVLALPAALPPTPAARLVAELLADVAGGSAPGATVRDRIAASLACRAAIKKNWPIGGTEAERLLADLMRCSERHRCPHGRPTVIRLAHEEIERRIGRR